ncbi:MAG: glycolate oxidase subunit GlcE [Gammaproteobacteria bacterium]
MPDRDCSNELRQQVETLVADKSPVKIQAGDSKAFYGNPVDANPLSVSAHRGIVHYEPTELVITARCGTSLTEIEKTLADNRQILGFEPPHFGNNATLGGSIATGLSGPARPFRGAARDFVLGMRILNGNSEVLHFGGEVMKNVAGYDVSRLFTGSLGTLGIMLDISLKVVPSPEVELTVEYEMQEADAIQRANELSAQAFPITAACYDGERLFLRLSGNDAAVSSAHKRIGGDIFKNAVAFWDNLREQRHPFFQSQLPLWRLSLAPATPPLEIAGKQFIDWGGAQRWLVSNEEPARIRKLVSERGGHATLFRGTQDAPVFQPLSGKMRELHSNLKLAFDPHGLFNPGRMYPEF